MTHPSDEAIADHYLEVMNNWSVLDLTAPISRLVNVYLVASFLYYHLHESILTDTAFDQLCKTLLKRHSEIADCPWVWHRRLVVLESLKAGTLFDLKPEAYPKMIVQIAMSIHRKVVDSD